MRGRSSEIPNPTAPTGRNLPAKGVSPGAAAQPLFGPEGVATTAGIERIDVDAIHPTTIHVRGADHGIHPGAKPSDDGFAGKTCRSDVAVDASPSGTGHACSAVPGLTPFAGRLRPVGAGGNGTCTRAHGPCWQSTPRWGWMHLILQPRSNRTIRKKGMSNRCTRDEMHVQRCKRLRHGGNSIEWRQRHGS